MHSCFPYSNRGSPKHDYSVGQFSGACRSCLLSLIMHTFVFDAFIQGTVTENDWQLLVVVRQVDCVVEDL
jgi:hypothetical protein